MMSDQSPNAIERGFDEECKDKADQQCGKQISPTKMGDSDPHALPDELGGARANGYP
jgi:hypothetical protein